jgi:hypothetical protein
MTTLDIAVVLVFVLFLIAAYSYAIWESWDSDRRQERLENRRIQRLANTHLYDWGQRR